MTIITTRLVVADDASISLEQPLPAGVYQATVELGEAGRPVRRPLTKEDFPQLDVGPFPEGVTFSREEMYGDDGR